jgi:hypothetical protein
MFLWSGTGASLPPLPPLRTERESFPSSGSTALLVCEQRQIRVSRTHIPTNRQHRKPLPSTIQTLGDHVRAKRYDKGLHPLSVGG